MINLDIGRITSKFSKLFVILKISLAQVFDLTRTIFPSLNLNLAGLVSVDLSMVIALVDL